VRHFAAASFWQCYGALPQAQQRIRVSRCLASFRGVAACVRNDYYGHSGIRSTGTLADFFAVSPLRGSGLEIERAAEKVAAPEL
jgi:hypothetical protein